MRTGSTPTGEQPPAWVRWVIRIALVAGVIGLGATVYLVGPSIILGQLRAIGAWFLVLIAIDVGMTALDAAAIHALTHGPGAPPYGRVVVAQLAGRAVNSVTPGGSLGEALKASILAEQTKSARVIAAIMYCGLASVCISLVMIAVGSPLTAVLLDLDDRIRFAMIVAGAIAAVVVVALIVLVRRGMLASVVGVAGRLRLVSAKRRKKWAAKLAEIDERLSGSADPAGRRRATLFVLLSRVLGWFSTWLMVATAGYVLDVPELAALFSVGIVLGWIATIVPMGLGIAEGGNYGLFVLIGAPAALGVSLALAKRVMQVLSAIIGFAVLGIYRVSQRAARRRSKRSGQAKAAGEKRPTGTSRRANEVPSTAAEPISAPSRRHRATWRTARRRRR